jgi:hypothetical protein
MSTTDKRLIKAFKIANFIDGVRWENEHAQMNFSEPNYYKDDLDEDVKLLSHWLCYIADRQMDYRRIWVLGGFVFSELADVYANSDDDLVTAMPRPGADKPFFTQIKHIGKDKPAKYAFSSRTSLEECQSIRAKIALAENYKITVGPVTFASRYYPSDYAAIIRTLLILRHFDKSLTRFIKLIYNNRIVSEPVIPQLLHGLYLLSYQNIPRLTATQLIESCTLDDIKNSANETVATLSDKAQLNSAYAGFINTDAYFSQKRAWCALRDYFKHRNYNTYLTTVLKRIGSDSGLLNLFDRSSYSPERREALSQLELPGDVWNYNPRFIKCVFGHAAIHGNFPRNLRYIYDHNEITVGYPEQFDFTFNFVPNMCMKDNCDICPFPILVKWKEEFTRFDKFCPAIVGSFCPVMLVACNYRHDCPGQQACQLYAILKNSN